ncbi:MAG TPA: hypothetical protein VGD78_03490 [Chthoniobacterales bacterium]
MTQGNGPKLLARVEKIDATPNPLSERSDAEVVDPGNPVFSPGTAAGVPMDLELTRVVLARTQEESLEALAALMRIKVELERTTRGLAQLLEETSEARRELERVRQQLREAEGDLTVPLEEHVRFAGGTAGTETMGTSGLTSGHEVPDVERDESLAELDDPQQERERLAAELEQLRATYFAYQVESNRSRESLEEEIGMLRQEVARRQTGSETTRPSSSAEGEAEDQGKDPHTPFAGAARLGGPGLSNLPQGHDALKRKLFRSIEQAAPPLEARGGPVRSGTDGGDAAE